MEDIELDESWRSRLTRLAGERREVHLVAGVVAAIVVLSLAAWSRGSPALIAPPSSSGSSYPPLPTASVSAGVGSPVAGGILFVHVAGAVRRPGLYQLAAGSRVQDAIDAAGGPRGRADLDALNLAEILVDASKVDVPVTGAGGVAASSSGTTAPGPSPSTLLVDLNTADQAALETIPGVGPVTATAILQFRSEVGAFQSVDQLLEVDGIGPVTLESLRSYVTV